MPNPIQHFIQDRFIQPAVDSGVEKALSANHPVAYGIGTVPDVTLAKAISQPHDANYALLYALYKLNTDVSGCVHKWAGGVTGPGWRITTMDPDAKATDALKQVIQDIECWLRNPNPAKLFASMLYAGITHWGIAGNFYWYVSEDKKGRPLELWSMHPALTKSRSHRARTARCQASRRVTGRLLRPSRPVALTRNIQWRIPGGQQIRQDCTWPAVVRGRIRLAALPPLRPVGKLHHPLLAHGSLATCRVSGLQYTP